MDHDLSYTVEHANDHCNGGITLELSEVPVKYILESYHKRSEKNGDFREHHSSCHKTR